MAGCVEDGSRSGSQGCCNTSATHIWYVREVSRARIWRIIETGCPALMNSPSDGCILLDETNCDV
uniref:Uncharacterized protein n=1 Tax=Setaria digitata TaxID=48799 RepID=A0A915Q5R6_9BILA